MNQETDFTILEDYCSKLNFHCNTFPLNNTAYVKSKLHKWIVREVDGKFELMHENNSTKNQKLRTHNQGRIFNDLVYLSLSLYTHDELKLNNRKLIVTKDCKVLDKFSGKEIVI